MYPLAQSVERRCTSIPEVVGSILTLVHFSALLIPNELLTYTANVKQNLSYVGMARNVGPR